MNASTPGPRNSISDHGSVIRSGCGSLRITFENLFRLRNAFAPHDARFLAQATGYFGRLAYNACQVLTSQKHNGRGAFGWPTADPFRSASYNGDVCRLVFPMAIACVLVCYFKPAGKRRTSWSEIGVPEITDVADPLASYALRWIARVSASAEISAPIPISRHRSARYCPCPSLVLRTISHQSFKCYHEVRCAWTSAIMPLH